MDWSNERYVRVYTRDTPEWALLSWEARGFFCLLLRAVDRAGVLSMGKSGHKALAALLRVPLEVVDRAMPELLEDGCIQVHGETVVIPNYIDAQEATQSDKQRQQECRAKRRDLAMRESVTLRDTPSRGATEPSRGVTPQPEPSQPVTCGHSVPCRAVPSVPDLAGASRPAGGQAPPRPEEHVLPAPTSGLGDNQLLGSEQGELLDVSAEPPQKRERKPPKPSRQQDIFRRMQEARERSCEEECIACHPEDENPRKVNAIFARWKDTTPESPEMDELNGAFGCYLNNERFREQGWPVWLFMSGTVYAQHVRLWQGEDAA